MKHQNLSILNLQTLQYAAKCIKESKAILITAGAGIGVDSGLPSFRGDEGLWENYPFFKQTKMRFRDAANPRFFEQDPLKFWFFYGHRFNIYKENKPHSGYSNLLQMVELKQNNYFVFTSNVDGHFMRAGFSPDRIVECHGSIFHFQCNNCWQIYEANIEKVEINLKTSEAVQIPTCPQCSQKVRPNILMFNDLDWLSDRTEEQQNRFKDWLKSTEGLPLTIIEVGAGETVLTIRKLSEDILCRDHLKKAPSHLIRINPHDQDIYKNWYNDKMTVIIDETATPESIAKASKQEKERSYVQIRAGAKQALEQLSHLVTSNQLII